MYFSAVNDRAYMPPKGDWIELNCNGVVGAELFSARNPTSDWMKPVSTTRPCEDELAAVMVATCPPLFQMNLPPDPPNAPALLNCTSVFTPPGDPLPPPPHVVAILRFPMPS